jgi:hypothetical protein
VNLAIAKSAPERRYTLGVLYAPNALDAHEEFTTDAELHRAILKFGRSGNRTLRRQHRPADVAGRIVELIRWPHEATISATVPGRITKTLAMPSGTVYVGVVWTRDAWEDVKAGKITGFSLGGRGVRVRDVREGAPSRRLGEPVAKAKLAAADVYLLEDGSRADETHERLLASPILGEPVRLTSGHDVGQVVQVAQLPEALAHAASLPPRSTVVGITWRTAGIRRLADTAELTLAPDGLFLHGD